MLDLIQGDIVRFKRDDAQGGAGVRVGEIGILTELDLNHYAVLVGNPQNENTRLVEIGRVEEWLTLERKRVAGDGTPAEYWSAHWHEYEPETKVIFRIFPDGDVLALFPEEASDSANWYNCTCYAHVGQHSGADVNGVIDSTRPATEAEYASLKRELENYPYAYRLKVYQRQTPQMRAAREREWRQTMGRE